MSIKPINILKHLAVITLLFLVSIVGILFFVVNISSESQLPEEENKATTFSPFIRTSANTIVNRKEFELK